MIAEAIGVSTRRQGLAAARRRGDWRERLLTPVVAA
jgi:hypothetical protein